MNVNSAWILPIAWRQQGHIFGNTLFWNLVVRTPAHGWQLRILSYFPVFSEYGEHEPFCII